MNGVLMTMNDLVSPIGLIMQGFSTWKDIRIPYNTLVVKMYASTS